MTDSTSSAGAIDYWREVVRRGVLAVGFSILRHRGQAWMTASLVAPQRNPVQQAAHAAIEIDKAIANEVGTPAARARQALAAHLETGPAALELAAYQAILSKRLYQEVQAAPAAGLGRLADPHEG